MQNSSRLFAALWFVAASCVGSPTPCAANTAVALHGDSELSGATVRLSDLFSGVPAVIDRDIAQAPPPGKSATYEAPVLEKLAEKYRLDWQAGNAADHVTLTSASTRIALEDMRGALVRKIQENGVRGDVDINFDGHVGDIDLPANQSDHFELKNFDFDAVSKRFHADMVAGKGSGAVNLSLAGHALVKRHVPVLAHHLDGGSVIVMTDIDWITVPDERITANTVTSADQLVGREVRHALSDGDLIHTNDVIPARLVTRGSLVTLKIETPFMQLTSQGRALQDGAEGEAVRVNNTQSNRMVEGVVTGPGEVSVHIAAGPKLASVQ